MIKLIISREEKQLQQLVFRSQEEADNFVNNLPNVKHSYGKNRVMAIQDVVIVPAICGEEGDIIVPAITEKQLVEIEPAEYTIKYINF